MSPALRARSTDCVWYETPLPGLSWPELPSQNPPCFQYFAFGRPNLIDDEQWNDVNVITGVLKAWLRELPTPLMTYELFPDFAALPKSTSPFCNDPFCLRSLTLFFPTPLSLTRQKGGHGTAAGRAGQASEAEL